MNDILSKFTLIFMFICTIYLLIENKNIKNQINNNLENFKNGDIVEHNTNTSTQDLSNKIKKMIQEEYNYDVEAIRNLGAISKSLLTGKNYHNTNPGTGNSGELTIPANLKVNGWAVAVPLGTIIMWSQTTPPPPNVDTFNPTPSSNWKNTYPNNPNNCWYPCIGDVTINNIKIPDMRGRFPIGQGCTGGEPSEKTAYGLGNYDGQDTGSLLGFTSGQLPLRAHSHNRPDHTHVSSTMGSGSSWFQVYSRSGNHGNERYRRDVTSSASGGGRSSTESYDWGKNTYTRNVVPPSTIVQFWIRVR